MKIPLVEEIYKSLHNPELPGELFAHIYQIIGSRTCAISPRKLSYEDNLSLARIDTAELRIRVQFTGSEQQEENTEFRSDMIIETLNL